MFVRVCCVCCFRCWRCWAVTFSLRRSLGRHAPLTPCLSLFPTCGKRFIMALRSVRLDLERALWSTWHGTPGPSYVWINGQRRRGYFPPAIKSPTYHWSFFWPAGCKPVGILGVCVPTVSRICKKFLREQPWCTFLFHILKKLVLRTILIVDPLKKKTTGKK